MYILGVILFVILISEFGIFNRLTLFQKETVTVNKSKDDSDVLVEDEKKPEKTEEAVETDEPKYVS